MAMSLRASRRSRGLVRLSVVAVACVALSCGSSFVGGFSRAESRMALRAEAAASPAPAPSSSVALVKVTEENSMTTASVLGGLAGLLVGGVWVGGALFAAASYATRKEDSDVSKALKGIAAGSLEALNFTAYVNDKYSVTDKVGSAITEAVDKAKTSGNEETFKSIDGFVDSAKEAIDSVDKDIGIKDTLGSLVTSAADLAFQAVDKAVELNEEYKITDQIVEKVTEATKKTSSSSSSA